MIGMISYKSSQAPGGETPAVTARSVMYSPSRRPTGRQRRARHGPRKSRPARRGSASDRARGRSPGRGCGAELPAPGLQTLVNTFRVKGGEGRAKRPPKRAPGLDRDRLQPPWRGGSRPAAAALSSSPLEPWPQRWSRSLADKRPARDQTFRWVLRRKPNGPTPDGRPRPAPGSPSLSTPPPRRCGDLSAGALTRGMARNAGSRFARDRPRNHPPICRNGSSARSIRRRSRTTTSAVAVIP